MANEQAQLSDDARRFNLGELPILSAHMQIPAFALSVSAAL